MSPSHLFSLILFLGACVGPVSGAHITDKLVVGLYAEPGTEGAPIRLLSSGTPLEVVERKGDFVEVRMADDKLGWVESRYVTEEKPAKVMLLEAQTNLRRLKEELQALKAGGTDVAAVAAPPPTPPSAREAQLRQALANAESRIGELERTLAERPVAEAAELQLETLRGTVDKTLHLLADARGLELRAVADASEEGLFGRYLNWIIGLAAVLVGFGAGVAFIDYRIRKRYGGFRI